MILWATLVKVKSFMPDDLALGGGISAGAGTSLLAGYQKILQGYSTDPYVMFFCMRLERIRRRDKISNDNVLKRVGDTKYVCDENYLDKEGELDQGMCIED